MIEPTHHPRASPALDSFPKETRGRIMTLLAKSGLEVAEAGSNARTWTAEQHEAEAWKLLSDLLENPDAQTLTVARISLRSSRAQAAVARLSGGRAQMWIDQAKGAA